MICPICHREVDNLYSSVQNGVYISERCEGCMASFGGYADGSRKFDRNWQQRHYAKDLIQPGDDEYVKAYGAEVARAKGWSEEDIRKHG